MAQIKLRVEVNKGRKGAPLEKLGEVAKQMEKFLRSLAGDLKLEVRKSEWIAENFRNGSISWDSAFQMDVSEAQVRHFNQCVEFVTDYDPDSESPNGLVSDATLLEYGRLGQRIDPDEVIGLGIYSGARNRLKWRRVEYRKASRIRQAMEAPLYTYGTVQGLFHSLLIEAQAPYFQVRELSTDAIVKCYFRSSLFVEIVKFLELPNAAIHVSGDMRLDRSRQSIGEMDVERIDRIGPVTDEEFQSFFGSSPDLTGDLTTEQFVRVFRDG